jgi:hypothetical protein
MKKTLLFAALLSASFMGFSQSQRTVFIEEFTQASCPPCETTTPALNAVIETNAEKIVQIRYQTSWPGVDPMNADNPTEVQTRVDYYGVTGVPDVIADGTSTGNPGSLPQGIIDARYGTDAPVLVEVEHTINDLLTMDVTVRIVNEGTEAFEDAGDKLRVALIEEVVSFPTPPGSTSLVDFEAVMKTFFTGTAGIDVPEIAAGETWTMTWEGLAIPDYVYDYNQLAVVAWVQNDASKGVHNSGHSSPQELTGYADLGVTNAVANTSDNLCDYEFSGEVTVENTLSTEVASYDVNLVINGAAAQTVNVTDPLVGGASNTVVFDAFDLPAGTSVISYNVAATGGDIATLNNNSSAVVVGKASAPQPSVSDDYESDALGSFPANAVVDMAFSSGYVVNAAFVGGTEPIGGYGNSEQSVFVNFWQWNPATVGNANGEIIIAEQFAVPADGNMSFDYAYTSYAGSQDRLQVQVSTDCGDNYTDVFNEAGSSLATAPEVNLGNSFFKPAAGDWVTENIDLSSYAGQDVLIRMYVTSAWGDQLYIDNIKMNSPVDVNELNENESLIVFPNPASQNMNFELSIEESANVSVRMIDMLGRTILTEQIGNNVKGAISHTLDVNNISNGAYLLFFQIDEREVVQRVNVSH